MEAILILVGTELLNGATVDTNSVYMAKELNKKGIKIKYKLSVGDRIDDIIESLRFAKKNADLIILSGGLGPTDDDLTKLAVSKFLNKKLITEDSEIEELKEKFKKWGYKILPKNLREVEKPEGAISIRNDVGMAPAFYIDGIVAFPGVPRELKNLFPKFLEFYEKNYLGNVDPIYIKDIIVSGLAESIVEDKIKDIFTDEKIEYEFLVKDYGILVRMQSLLSNKNTVEKIKEKIYNNIGEYIIGEDFENIGEKLLEVLKEKNLKLSTAESCTGGKVGANFIGVSGASTVYYEGIISYDNDSKVERLKVSKNILEKYGAVSEETAREMVKGLKTDVGISTTGIAGPLGGSEEKPVGLVYIGLKNKDKIKIIKNIFRGDREDIRNKATETALVELYKFLLE